MTHARMSLSLFLYQVEVFVLEQEAPSSLAILRCMRTWGLLYHKEASGTSVYLYIPDVTIGFVIRVAVASVVMDQSHCLELKV